MVKQVAFVGAVGASLLLALLTPAQKKPAAPENAASVLAALEGTINFCTKINPAAEAKYKDLAKLLTNNQTDEAIAQIRNSKEYKDAGQDQQTTRSVVNERGFRSL